MKRVAVLNFEPASPYSLQASAEARSLADAPKSSRQKLLHRPWDGLKQHRGFAGAPLTEASVTSLRMQARGWLLVMFSYCLQANRGSVDVTNSLLAQPATRLSNYKSEYRIVPVKRALTIEGHADQEARPGNKLPLYIELRPLLEKAAEDGITQIDMAKASFAHSTAILQGLHPDPRTQLAAHGAPDLSFITDMTEPSSPHVMSPPRVNAEAKSPTKRDTIPSSPLQNSCNRLKAAKVDLFPTASPKAEPSPTKSSSAPSTPLKDLFTTTKLAATPSFPSPTFGLHPVTEEEVSWPAVFTPSYKDTSSLFKIPQQQIHSSPTKLATASPLEQTQSEVFTPRTESKQPGKTFKVPSFFDSSSLDPSTQSADSELPSPTKYARPVAPTPSKWGRFDSPSTPLPETPSKDDLLGLVASIPAGTPEPAQMSFDVNASNNISNFDFGPHSLIFATCTAEGSGTHSEESQRAKDLNARRRRQSEPLFKTAFKVQKRRRSASPHKSIEETPKAPTNKGISSSPASASGVAAEKPLELADILHMTPLASNALNADATPGSVARGTNGLFMNTPSIQVSPAAEQAVTPAAPDSGVATIDNSSVLNIDVRQNPDIFGIHRPDHAVNQLAQMAQDRCDGHAKVVTSYENGRFIVRFKLPAEYASAFPPSQGFDESRFTTSPSAISSSPKIRYDEAKTIDASSQSHKANPFVAAEPKLKPASPPKTSMFAYSSPTRPTRSSPLKLPPLTQSPLEPPSTGKRSALWDQLSTRSDNDETLVVGDFGTTSLMQSSPMKQVVDTPVSEEKFTSFILDTPSVTGIGIVNRDTPEHLRFTTLHSPYQGTPLAFTPDVRNTTASVLTPSMKATAPYFGLDLQTPTCAEAYSMPASASSVGSQPPPTSKPSTPAFGTTPQQQASTPSVAEPITASESRENVDAPTTPPPAEESTTPESSPTLNLSFTPVNQRSSRENTPKRSPEATSPTPKRPSPALATEDQVSKPESPAAVPSPAEQSTIVDDDSPGREHMRKFIERNKSRRLSTLENGSPVVQQTERKPLGVKSPNAASPLKAKRKLEDAEPQSPLKKPAEPVAKRTRRTLRGTKPKASDDIDELATDPAPFVVSTENADVQGGNVEMEDATVTRRSKRLRPLDRAASANGKLTASKSAIPTLMYRSGAGRGAVGPVLNASVRNEQQELMHQTRMNTRKNKGNAEYPAQVLARRSQELQDDEAEEKAAEQLKLTAKERKTVGWREPLEAHQEKPKKGRPASKVAKPSGIAKPRKAAPTTKVEPAEARPQRMTRSRTRSQA